MKKQTFIGIFSAVVIGVAAFFVFGGIDTQASSSTDCDDNAIMKCGALDVKTFQSKYKANTKKDLDNVYNHYGITKSVVDNLGSAKMGRVYADGRVTVDGEVVATGAISVGRQNIAGSHKISINKETYYERATSVSFRSTYITAYVILDQYGKFKEAILTSCGNPVRATAKPKPYYVCSGLDIIQNSNTKYIFKANTVVRDATLKYVTYTVKDGSGKTVSSIRQNAGAASPTYDQVTPGAYSVQAVATVSAANKDVTTPVGVCKGNFTVKNTVVPSYACTAISQTIVSRTDRTFEVDATVTGGAKITKVTVNYGDGKTGSGAYGTIFRHTYSADKSYDVTASLDVLAGGKTYTNVTSDACGTQFTVSPEECKPGVPVGDVKCTDVIITHIVATTDLPHTGPAEMIGSFIGIGALVYAVRSWAMSRRSLRASR